MGVKVCCSPEEGMSYKVGLVQHPRSMRIAAVKSTVFTILLFPALGCVCEGLIFQSAGATDGALVKREANVAPVRLRNRVHTIWFSSKSGFAREIQTDNAGEETSKATVVDKSKRQKLRKVLARRLQAASDRDCNTVAVATGFRWTIHRRTGPSNDPARERKPLTLIRPVKLFILCANHGLRQVKKVGVRVAMTSPSRSAPASRHLISYGNNHRRALKESTLGRNTPPFSPRPFFPPVSTSTLPPLPFSPPASPQLQVPPLPFPLPLVTPLPFTILGSPLLPEPTSPITSPATLIPGSSIATNPMTLPLPLLPPLPIQIPPLPSLPSSSFVKSFPPHDPRRIAMSETFPPSIHVGCPRRMCLRKISPGGSLWLTLIRSTCTVSVLYFITILFMKARMLGAFNLFYAF